MSVTLPDAPRWLTYKHRFCFKSKLLTTNKTKQAKKTKPKAPI